MRYLFLFIFLLSFEFSVLADKPITATFILISSLQLNNSGDMYGIWFLQNFDILNQ